MIRLASRTPVNVALGGHPVTWFAHNSENHANPSASE